MSETHSTSISGSSTWTEEEIRQQPDSWIRALKNLANQRDAIDAFLAPLLQQSDLQIVLTGAGTSAFIGDIIAPWLSHHTGGILFQSRQLTSLPIRWNIYRPTDRRCSSPLRAQVTARKV